MSNEQYPKLTLSEAHQAMLKESAISSEVAIARGYQTIEKKVELERRGFKLSQRQVPTLLIPIYGVCDGNRASLFHHRPDQPRQRDGKRVKYEFPTESIMLIDVHPRLRAKVRDPLVPLIITEGVKKADAAISAGLCCIALLGVWNWRGTNEFGGKTTLPDLDGIAWKGKDDQPRRVYVCFDSDAMTNPAVHKAMERISGVLKIRGAEVLFIYLPSGPDGVKWGLDDYLAAGNSKDDLLNLALTHLRPLPVELTEKALEPSYRETPQGLVWMKRTPDGPAETLLASFSARIVKEIITDDGAEQTQVYWIEGCCKGRSRTFEVPIDYFDALGWPPKYLGSGAYFQPGFSAKDHVRVAIRQLSGDVPEERVYTHLGWRQLEKGKWCYLHAGGVIGEQEGVNVKLSGKLTGYRLPTPPDGEALKNSILAALRLIDLGPETLTFPLLAGVFRAVLGKSDFSLALYGKTGTFKSELAALVQRFFGRSMDANNLPGSWSDTENALEELAFLVKDALLVIDDFCPVGSTPLVQSLHAKADRVLRAQGNGSGRQRMNRDGTLRPQRPPRGLILSTGEDIPKGQSLQARQFLLEVRSGDIKQQELTRCQKDASAGLYSACMAGYLLWLSSKYEEVKSQLKRHIECNREDIEMSGHRRTPGIVASLLCGMESFLEFAEDMGALTEAETEKWKDRAWTAIIAAGQSQTEHHLASEPTTRFLDLVRSAISSGAAHVAWVGCLRNPDAWGWRQHTIGTGEYERHEWRPQGKCIGYVDEDRGDLYLLPDPVYSVVKRLATDSGEELAMSSRTMWKRLNEAHLLASTEKARETLPIRRVLGGKTQSVLHLSISALGFEKPDISDIGEDRYPEVEEFVGEEAVID